MLALNIPLGVTFTAHALERANERAWQLPFQSAADERLARIIEHGQLQVARPAWLHPTTSDADAWLVIGDLAFPLQQTSTGFVAVTCLTRGGLCTTADRRARAVARRQADRERARQRRHNEWCGSSAVQAAPGSSLQRTHARHERGADRRRMAEALDTELAS